MIKMRTMNPVILHSKISSLTNKLHQIRYKIAESINIRANLKPFELTVKTS